MSFTTAALLSQLYLKRIFIPCARLTQSCPLSRPSLCPSVRTWPGFCPSLRPSFTFYSPGSRTPPLHFLIFFLSPSPPCGVSIWRSDGEGHWGERDEDEEEEEEWCSGGRLVDVDIIMMQLQQADVSRLEMFRRRRVWFGPQTYFFRQNGIYLCIYLQKIIKICHSNYLKLVPTIDLLHSSKGNTFLLFKFKFFIVWRLISCRFW